MDNDPQNTSQPQFNTTEPVPVMPVEPTPTMPPEPVTLPTFPTEPAPIQSPKKSKKKLIIILIILAFISILGFVALVLFVLPKLTTSSPNGQSDNSGRISDKELKGVARWGSLPLGVSFLLDDEGGISFTYPHGHRFGPIYVEKMLGNKKVDLNTLAVDIANEKASDKYSFFYKRIEETPLFNKIEKTEKVRVGSISAVYFESTRLTDEDDLSVDNKKINGYTFKFGDQYFAVYGLRSAKSGVGVSEDKLKQRLQLVVNSIQEYKGESFFELKNDFKLKSYFNNGFSNEFAQNSLNGLNSGELIFTLNLYGAHISEGIFGCNEGLGDCADMIDVADFAGETGWDGSLDTIYDYADKIKYADDFINWVESDWVKDRAGSPPTVETISEKDVTINGIPMKRYVGKYLGNRLIKGVVDSSVDHYFVVYTFIYSGKPYFLQREITYDWKDGYSVRDDSEKAMFVRSAVELLADTLIRTIRFIPEGSSPLEYYHSW